MTREIATFVAIPQRDWEQRFADLARKAERALARYGNAPPGDRREAVRYERLCRTLENKVHASIGPETVRVFLQGAELLQLEESVSPNRHPWSLRPCDVRHVLGGTVAGGDRLRDDTIVFELRDALDAGQAPPGEPVSADGVGPPPTGIWRAPAGLRGLRAVESRWRSQLAQAAAGQGEPLVPSGVSNRVLTEGLRDFVEVQAGAGRVDGRVLYRDGSEARPFPLRAFETANNRGDGRQVVRIALMSLRHPEMDATVDAAWLRNRLVSQVRPSAETDELVYQTSRRQFDDLAALGPVCLWLYQTGLEPAVVGFYRALVHHLLDKPGSVTVVPFFYRRRDGSYQEGRPWANRC